jgi:uncharacterized membrane protein
MMVNRFLFYGSWNHQMGWGMSRMGGSLDAEEIIKPRYTRGEITKKQYDQMVHDLRYGRN